MDRVIRSPTSLMIVLINCELNAEVGDLGINILKTAIVVIHQLPENEDTLWLRVLGKGGTQKRAVEELTTLPENNPFRENLLEILADWRKNLELRDNLSREEEEEIMNLSPAYLQQREETILLTISKIKI